MGCSNDDGGCGVVVGWLQIGLERRGKGVVDFGIGVGVGDVVINIQMNAKTGLK